MSVLGWAFVAFNVIICVGCLGSTMWNYNALGNRERWSSPGNWIWIWQLLGIGLVVTLHFAPWHLVWWFLIGYPACYLVGKILMRLGYNLLKD